MHLFDAYMEWLYEAYPYVLGLTGFLFIMRSLYCCMAIGLEEGHVP